MQAEGKVVELILVDGQSSARIACPAGLIPPPGAYVLAYPPGSDQPLATAVFAARYFGDSTNYGTGNFLIAPPAPRSWTAGMPLFLRGPLGHGFGMPASARRVALVAFDSSPRRLLTLMDAGFERTAAITLVCENSLDDLPLQVEVQPLRALAEVCSWADYLAFDIARESIPVLKQTLVNIKSLKLPGEAQVLIRTPMPCGAMADCGVCGVELRGGIKLACDDGPVFDLRSMIG
jgi:dihydroorotate dehydrogenase electron transfer subunit